MSASMSQRAYRILVVDDNRSIHDDFRKILCTEDTAIQLSELESSLFGECEPTPNLCMSYQVDSALQGKEALEMVQAAVDEDCPYALAFVDMRMPPGWDGLKTIQHFWEVDPEIQVVICTAYSDHAWDDFAQRLTKQEQWLILKKPFDNVEVCQLAAGLTKKWELQRKSHAKLCDLERLIDGQTAALQEEIRQRNDADRALREQELRLRAIVDTAPDGIVIFDESERIEMANLAVSAIFGYTQEELCGKSLTELLKDSSGALGSVSCQKEHRFSDTETSLVSGELKCHRNDGTVIWIQLTVSEFTSGGCRSFTGIVRDLTEFKQLQSELAHAQKLESVGQLAAWIAHEINTPTQYVGDNTQFLKEAFGGLQGVMDGLEKLLEAARDDSLTEALLEEIEQMVQRTEIDYLNEEFPQSVEQSVERVQRGAQIVRAMKEFAHPGSEEKSLVNLNTTIETTINVSRNEWKYVAEIETDFDQDLPDISCLPGELIQVFLNLIVNAARAIGIALGEDVSEKGKITLSTRRRGVWTEVLVQDTGTGIPEDIRARIFDPFFTTKRVGKGTGQGLAIARSVVVDKHNGTIDCKSELGKGTTFIVRLPVENEKSREEKEAIDENTSLVCG